MYSLNKRSTIYRITIKLIKSFILDVSEQFLIGGQRQEPLEIVKNQSHTILSYNKPKWISLEAINGCRQICNSRNFDYSNNINNFKESSAVIFCLSTK